MGLNAKKSRTLRIILTAQVDRLKAFRGKDSQNPTIA
jgi:hypothetical protein